MSSQIISVDAHEVDAGDLIVGRMSHGPVERVVHKAGWWYYMDSKGLIISTGSLASRVQVARERRDLLDPT